MPESTIGPRIAVTGEAEFKAAMASINNEFKMLGSEMKLAVSQFDKNDKSTEALTARNEVLGKEIDSQKGKIALLTTQYDKQNDKLTTLQASLEATKAAFAADSAEVAQAQRAYDRQNNTVMALQTQLNGATTGLNDMERALENNNQAINENSRDMGKFGEAVKEMGKVVVAGILAIGAAFAGATVAGVKMADDLQKSLNGVQSSTGTTDEGMGDMRETMLAIYNDNFGEGFEDIGAALAVVAQQTGLTGEALKETTENALMLRDTFGMEVEESVRGVNQVMKQFGVDSDTAYNLIAQGAQKGLNANGDLLDTLNEYGGTFKAQGFSAEEMFNMLSNASKSGIRDVDLAADAIKEFGIRSKDGSKASAEGFQALGLSAGEMTKAFGAGGDTAKEAFTKTTTALLAMKDPVAQNAAGVALFGTQWEDLGLKGVTALVNTKGSIAETTDALKKINDVKYNTFGESVEGIKRQLLTGIVLPLGEQVLPKMNEFAAYIKTNMPAIQNEIKFAFDTIGTAIADVATAVSGLIDWFVKYKAIIVPIISTVSAIIVNAWLVTAIAATKTAIINSKAAAKITAKWLWMGLKSTFHALKVVASWAATGAGAIAAGLVMIAQSAVVVAKWVWMGLQSMIHAGRMAAAWIIAMGPIAWVSIAIAGIAILIAANWDKVKAKTIEIFTSVSTWLKNKWGEIKTSASQTFESMKNAVSDKVSGVKTAIVNGITTAVEWVKALPSQAVTWGSDMIMGIVRGIKNAAHAVGDAVKGVAQNIRSFLHFSVPDEGPLTDYESWMPDFMGGLASGIEKNKFKVANAIQGLSTDMTTGIKYNALPNAAGINQDMVLKTAQEVARGVLSSMQTQAQPTESSQPIQINLHMDGKVISQQLFRINQGRLHSLGVNG